MMRYDQALSATRWRAGSVRRVNQTLTCPPHGFSNSWSWRRSGCGRSRGRAGKRPTLRVESGISAERMKYKREHRAPLSHPAVEILDAARSENPGDRSGLSVRSAGF